MRTRIKVTTLPDGRVVPIITKTNEKGEKVQYINAKDLLSDEERAAKREEKRKREKAKREWEAEKAAYRAEKQKRRESGEAIQDFWANIEAEWMAASVNALEAEMVNA